MKRMIGTIFLLAVFLATGCATTDGQKAYYAAQLQMAESNRQAAKDRAAALQAAIEAAGKHSMFKVQAPTGQTINASSVEVNLSPLFLLAAHAQGNLSGGQPGEKPPDLKQYVEQPTWFDRATDRVFGIATAILPGLWPYLTAQAGFNAAEKGYGALATAAANAGHNVTYTQTIGGQNNSGRVQPVTNNVSGTGHTVTGPVDQTSTPTVVVVPPSYPPTDTTAP